MKKIFLNYPSIIKDYYKPIKTVSNFDKNDNNNNNNIEYERKGDKDKTLTIIEYLNMIRPYLGDIINDHKIHGEWKIQLTTTINLVSSKDSDETCTMHTISDNIEIMIGNKTKGNIKKMYLILFCKNIKKIEKNQ